MSVTPLLKSLRVDGGTFYTFQPATKDLTLMFSNTDNIKLNFSKFVCIKLPEWANVTKQSMYIDPNVIESVNDNSANDDANTFFVKAYLQNYSENLNTLLDANREDNNFANTSEAAFLKSLLATKYNNEPPLQITTTSTYEDVGNVTRNVFTEVPNSDDYEQIVQFIGDINMVNNAKKDGNEYVEIFGYVPTSSGKLNNVQFIQNLDLRPVLAQVPENTGNDWIEGQEEAYENSTEDTYAGAVYDTITKKYDVSRDVDLLKIDWNDLEKIESASKFNNGNFDFNAVMLYYDVFDKNDESTVSRNLYGIFVIDSFDVDSPTNNVIPTFTKYQPDDNQSGNSYSFRFNLSFSASTNIVTTTSVINDYSTYSMELYMHALEMLRKIAIRYDEIGQSTIEVHTKINRIEQTILSIYNQSNSNVALEQATEAIRIATEALQLANQAISAENENVIEKIFVDNVNQEPTENKSIYLSGTRIPEFNISTINGYKINEPVYTDDGIYISTTNANKSEPSIISTTWKLIASLSSLTDESKVRLVNDYPLIDVGSDETQEMYNIKLLSKLTSTIKSRILIDDNEFTWSPLPTNESWNVLAGDVAKDGWLYNDIESRYEYVKLMIYVSGDATLSSSWDIIESI